MPEAKPKPDLESWLAEIGLDGYLELFERERLDLDVLSNLSESDFKDLGIPLGDRKRLAQAIAARATPLAAGKSP